MLKKIVNVFFLLLLSTGVYAQQITVKGVVRDNADIPIADVNVRVKGTNTGTVTDFDGNYSIKAANGDTLVFSNVSFETKELVVTGANHNVSLGEGNTLDEVIVTALGISREKKSLGYAVQKVKGDNISRSSESNVVNALAGKISGVQIQGTGNIGGSSRILLRGASSLTGNNQPLFVVDGVPVDNSNYGSFRQAYGSRDDVNGNVDYGNSAQDINPDDIDNVTVLKGANAAALYGSRAANGVILITTKKGTSKNGIGVDVNYGISIESAYDFPEFQNTYGGGQSLDFAMGLDNIPMQHVSTDESWGPKLDGRLVRQWDGNGNGGEVRPWVAHPDNYRNFFNTGQIQKTNFAISNANDLGNFRVSYTKLAHSGIVPNSSIDRNTFNINLNGKINKLSVSTSVNFVNTKGKGRPKTGGSSDNLVYNMVIWSQRQLDIERLRNYERADGSQYTWRTSGFNQTNVRANNPFWLANKDYQDDEKGRYIGNFKVNYDLTDNLSASLRYGFDKYNDLRRDRRAIGSRYTPYFISKAYNFSEQNVDIMLNYKNNKMLSDFSLNAMIGTNFMTNTLESNTGATSGGLNIDGIYSLANSVDTPILNRGLSNKKTNSIYASTSLGYQNLLYLDLTARNDWSSTLPKDNWSYFYPSVTGSLIFSKLIESNSLTYGKLRAGWAKVGNDTNPYRLYNDYGQGASVGGNPIFFIPSTLNNEKLKPEITTSFETGVDVKFFKNRLGLDLTYYTGKTKNQIMPITVSNTTGYNRKWVNAGVIKNYGLEMQLVGAPIENKNFSWNIGVNWAKNINEVVELADGLTSYVHTGFYPTVTLESRIGEPYSSIYARKVARDPNGNMIVGENGYYVNGEIERIGSVLPNWTSGITNEIKYKNFSLSGLIDIQSGGVIYGRGYQTALYAGTLAETAANGVRENGVVADGVMNVGTSTEPIYETNTIMAGSVNGVAPTGNAINQATAQFYRLKRRNPGDFTVFDASFVKLREVSLGYSLPKKFMSQLPFNRVKVEVVGRNLAFLSRNTPKGYDPESSGNSSGNIQGREYGQLPTARTIGMNVKLSF